MTEPGDTDPSEPDPSQPDPYGTPPPPPAYGTQPYGAPPAGNPAYGTQPYQPQPYGWNAAAPGPVGQVRSTGTCILLAIVTLGIYTYVWFYKVHKEMHTHRNGQGLGGGLALVLTIFVHIVMPYITSAEVGAMYEARGQAKPVSGATGLWYFPGAFIIVGPIVWFVKTNGALNDYWASLGATR